MRMPRILQALVAALDAGPDIPESLATRVGPPLSHPLDPRHEHIDSETELRLALESPPRAPGLTYRPPPDDASLDKAAEPPPDYDV